MDDAYVSLPVACQRLGVGYQMGRDLLLRGVLRGEKRGSRWLVTMQSLAQLMEKRMVPAALERSGGGS